MTKRNNEAATDAKPDTETKTGDTPASPPAVSERGPSPRFAKSTPDHLARRFNHHPPQGNQAERYGEVRAAVRECAEKIVDRCPLSPELSRALNALDEAMFLANAAIARNEPRFDQ